MFAMLSAEAVSSAAKLELRPGRWHIVSSLMADAVNGKSVGQPVGESENLYACYSDADRDPVKMMERHLSDGECHAYQAHAANGAMSISAVCPAGENGSSSDFTGSGTYSSEQMSLKVDIRVEGAGNQANLSGTLTSNWEGACRGDEDQAD
jgi:hypothetical protein